MEGGAQVNAVDRMADLNRQRAEDEALKADMRLCADEFQCTEAERREMWAAAMRDKEGARVCFGAMVRSLRGDENINERIRRHVQYKPPTPEEDLAARSERARLDRQEQERRAA